jgi:arsenate reductase-like glutaredoxin family protein
MKNMGVIARNENQLTLIYSSNTRIGKHTLSYLTGMDGKYLDIDIAKTKVSDTQWVEIADSLGVKVGDLVDKRELDISTESSSEFGTNDWLKIIQNNDFVISRPIVIKGKITKQIDNPTEIMEFFKVDSAGLEQSPSNDTQPDIERTTDNENFIEKNK